MPLTFPSHQGLLAPLWRRWPGACSILPLWAGAAVPDLVDGAFSFASKGHFAQGLCHSLLGATTIGVPAALLFTAALRAAARALARPWRAAPRRLPGRAVTWLDAVDNGSARGPGSARLAFEAWSACIGAWSHVLFDLLSHSHSRLLWPFTQDPAWLGTWWTSAWFHASVPGYPDYPVGPHFAGWLLLSALGIVMFCRWPPRRRV